MLSVRGNPVGGDVRLMRRDRVLLGKLAQARWLTTNQVADLCFPDVSVECARRRLRLLGKDHYIASVQSNPMAEAMHSLGRVGRDVLVKRGWPSALRLERALPTNLEHFIGINDIRVACERSARSDGFAIGFFFACWELHQQGWRYRLIPDAACHVECRGRSCTLLFEYDRASETLPYIARTKFKLYAAGLEGLSFSLVLVADTARRLEQLREHASRYMESATFSCILHETLRSSWGLAPYVS